MSLLITTWAPLVAAWLLLAAAGSALVAVVAILIHHLVRGTVPSRLVWGSAVVIAALLVWSQPWRQAPTFSDGAAVVATFDATDVSSPSAQPWPQRVWTALAGAPDMLREANRASAVAAATVVRAAPLPIQAAMLFAWPVCSAALLLLGVWSYRRQRQLVQSSVRQPMHGSVVHVTASSGPAVFGVTHPTIIVPGWLLDRPEGEQQLVIRHEQAHIEAHDPALLLGACVLTALMPLNPCAWFLLARLRLAIELDCDARVLGTGTSARRYGELLIDLSAAATQGPHLTGAPAFSHRASHLERRLRSMTDRPTTHTGLRRSASLALGTLALVAACGAELPTSAELQGMDVAAAEKRAFVASPDLSAARYIVDGKEVTEAEAKAISAARIASIDIRKGDKSGTAVLIVTQDSTATYAASKVSPDGAQPARVVIRADSAGPLRKTFDGLLFVDGKKTDPAAMSKIDPNSIESVEVIKGAAATQRYGAEGANGVIQITTKKKD